MELEIGKDIKITNPSEEILHYCCKKLTLTNPNYIIAKKLGRYVGKMEKEIKLYIRDSNSVIVPFGCLRDVWEIARNDKYCFNWTLNFKPFRANKMEGSINLYDYQKRALNSLKQAKNGVLEAPCGSGKTQIGLALIKEIGGKALWLTHTHKLLEQSMSRAKQYYVGDFGTITEGKVDIGRDITFATVQTMRNLDPSIYQDAFDIVIVDECHHAVGTPTKIMQFYKVISNINARYKYGLSATLSRGDNLITCVYSLLGNKAHTITESEVGSKIIKAEHLKYDLYLDYDILDYSDPDGTLNFAKLIKLLSGSKERNTIIATNVVKYFKMNKKQLVLCHRISQIESLKFYIEMLSENQCTIECVTGKTKQTDRKFESDVIIATYALAKEGLDIPTLDVVHFATPQKDKAIVKQSAGRVERNYEGKKTPYIIDYVDENIPYCVNCFKIRKRILSN